jgi:hypothetical protein
MASQAPAGTSPVPGDFLPMVKMQILSPGRSGSRCPRAARAASQTGASLRSFQRIAKVLAVGTYPPTMTDFVATAERSQWTITRSLAPA